MSRLRGITFGFDGTLTVRNSSVYDGFSAVAEACHVEDPVLKEAMIQDCVLWNAQGMTQIRDVYEYLIQKYNVDISYEVYDKLWRENQVGKLVIAPDAAYVLEELGKQYKLGCVTNGRIKDQSIKLENSGLLQYFNATVISGEPGVSVKKPGKLIFLKIAERLKLNPDEIMHVGNIFSTDILGAQRAGMRVAWFQNDETVRCGLPIPIIHHLSELLDLVNEKEYQE